jgi:integrase
VKVSIVGTSRKRRSPRAFGSVRQLPSGRWNASYRAHPGKGGTVSSTHATKYAAERWLADQRIGAPRQGAGLAAVTTTDSDRILFADYAADWLANADHLKPRTAGDYQRMLDRYLLPQLGTLTLAAVTPRVVERWYHDLGHETGKVQRTRCYQLLSVIMRSAWRQELIASTPCRIAGASTSKRSHEVRTASAEELAALVTATPERFRAMVYLAAWCQLRQGELAELRRRDIDMTAGTVRVARAVSRVNGRQVVGTPKSDAGRRTVAVPPPLLPVLADHLERFAQDGPDGLLFPSDHGKQLQPSSIYGWFYPAREAAGRPDLRFHDLRHAGAVMLAQDGATLKELMARLGHSTPQAAMIYQHVATGRDAELAQKLGARISVV